MKRMTKNEKLTKIKEEHRLLLEKVKDSIAQNKDGFIGNLNELMAAIEFDEKQIKQYEAIQKAKSLIEGLVEQIINATSLEEVIKVRNSLNYYINKIKKELKNRNLSDEMLSMYQEKASYLRKEIAVKVRILKREENINEIEALINAGDLSSNVTKLLRNESRFNAAYLNPSSKKKVKKAPVEIEHLDVRPSEPEKIEVLEPEEQVNDSKPEERVEPEQSMDLSLPADFLEIPGFRQADPKPATVSESEAEKTDSNDSLSLPVDFLDVSPKKVPEEPEKVVAAVDEDKSENPVIIPVPEDLPSEENDVKPSLFSILRAQTSSDSEEKSDDDVVDAFLHALRTSNHPQSKDEPKIETFEPIEKKHTSPQAEEIDSITGAYVSELTYADDYDYLSAMAKSYDIKYHLESLYAYGESRISNLQRFFKNLPTYIRNRKLVGYMASESAAYYQGSDFVSYIAYAKKRNSIINALKSVFSKSYLHSFEGKCLNDHEKCAEWMEEYCIQNNLQHYYYQKGRSLD